MREALISVKPTFVERFLAGEKSVELRKRSVALSPGSRLWIYSTLPKGCMEAVAEVNRVVVGTPWDIWDKYQDALGLSKSTYSDYVNGASTISAIVTKSIWNLPAKMDLSMLKSQVPGFHPPQFIKYMTDSDPVLISIIRFLFLNVSEEYLKEIGLTKKAAYPMA